MKFMAYFVLFMFVLRELILIFYNFHFENIKKGIINCINLIGLAFIAAFFGTI